MDVPQDGGDGGVVLTGPALRGQYLVNSVLGCSGCHTPQKVGGGGPDMDLVHAARVNIRTHLRYIGYLASHRNWLAGDRLSHADLVAAAHLSCVDFLGDVPWEANETAKLWYARVKSRPSFRPRAVTRC